MIWSADKIGRVLIWGGVCGMLAVILKCLGITSFLSTFFTLWTISAGTYIFFGTVMVDVGKKFVLITGCDSGFGHALALHLNAMGFGVFACCLDAKSDGAKKLQEKGSSKLHVLQMDITNTEQINKARTEVNDHLGSEGTLWGIVNNTGIGVLGAIEWSPIELFKHACDVNLFGAISVTQAFLPLIRKAKGRVVTVSSIYGRTAFPCISPYAISKWGIQAFSDCLRSEMKPFGVKVSLIEPGNFMAGTKIVNEDKLRIWSEMTWDTMNEEVKEAYGGKEAYDEVIKSIVDTSYTGYTNLGPVIDVMTEALVQQFPQARYQPMTITHYFVMFIYAHFPEWFTDPIIHYMSQNFPEFIALHIKEKIGN